MNEFDIINAYYALFLIVFGTFSNAYCFIVCSRKELKNTFMFTIYRFLFVNDIVSLYTWNLDTVTYGLAGYLIERSGTLICGIFSWFTFVTLQWSSWLLVLISIERYLFLKYRHINITKTIDNNANLCALAIGISLAVINGIVLIIFMINVPWSTSNFDFLNNSFYQLWCQLHLFAFFSIPAFLLVLFSILTSLELFTQRKRISNPELQDDFKKISILMLSFVLAFIVLSGPNSIMSYFIRRVSEAPNSITKINGVQSIQFTFTACNVFILYTNRTFRRTARKVRNNMIGIVEI